MNPYASFFSQVFRQYKDKLLEKSLGRNANKPWMKYREIELISDILQTLKPERCLEWGAGYSTIFFPHRAGDNVQWLSVEHDEEWANSIKSTNPHNAVRIQHVMADNPLWSKSSQDGTYTDFRKYIEFPAPFGPFDFVLVDGRARSACLHFAEGILSERSVVVLHDANRLDYKDGCLSYRYQTIFTDYRSTIGGIWVGSNSLELSTLLNIEAHRKLWRIYSSLDTFNVGKTMHI